MKCHNVDLITIYIGKTCVGDVCWEVKAFGTEWKFCLRWIRGLYTAIVTNDKWTISLCGCVWLRGLDLQACLLSTVADRMLLVKMCRAVWKLL